MKTRVRQLLLRAVLLLTMLTVPYASLRAEDITRYWFNFPIGSQGEWMILLPAAVEKTAFRDSMTAIDLEAVICDGVTLKPEIRLLAGRPDRTTLNVGHGNVVYQFSQGFFECWVDIERKEGQVGEIKHFDIPQSAKRIEIKYRVRMPNAHLSSILTVTFVASDEKTHILVAP